MAYTPSYTKPYADGFKNKPNETTPITADVMNGYDDAIVHIEEYLEDNPSGTDVEWNQITTSGTKIAEITIGEETTNVYAPNGSGSASIDYGDEDAFDEWSETAENGEIFVRTDDNDNSTSEVEFLTDFFVMESGYTYASLTSCIVKIGKAIIGNVNIAKSSNFDVGSANTFASINEKYLPLKTRFRTAGILSSNGYSAADKNGYVSINTTINKVEIWAIDSGLNNIRFQFVCMME